MTSEGEQFAGVDKPEVDIRRLLIRVYDPHALKANTFFAAARTDTLHSSSLPSRSYCLEAKPNGVFRGADCVSRLLCQFSIRLVPARHLR